jgi:hypothetical protein
VKTRCENKNVNNKSKNMKNKNKDLKQDARKKMKTKKDLQNEM